MNATVPRAVLTSMACALACAPASAPVIGAEVETDATPQALILEALTAEHGVPVAELELEAIDESAGIYLARYDWIQAWEGGFSVFRVEQGELTWQTTDEGFTEHSVHRARIIDAPGHPEPLIEVVGITHMGNGSVHVYSLDGPRLEPLFEAKIVDWHDDGELFTDGMHRVRYVDANADGFADIKIDGAVEVDGERVREVHEVFPWHAATRRFVAQP